jgi:phage gpG-like protein
MTSFSSLASFAAHVVTLNRDVKLVEHAIVAKACSMVCAEARRVLGSYDYGWPQLQPETIANKMRGDSPLLESGELHDSITWNAEGNVGHVGSDSDKAVWMELGTARIPPRSFLVGAAQAMEGKIHAMAAKAVMAVLAGRGLHSHEFGELIHVLKHAYHKTKELAKELLEPDEGNRR